MACCHKVMLLLDTAGACARQKWVQLAALRLLTYLSCRFGLARVHWAFKFFDSQGARSRPSRASDFRELGTRSWEDFEEELEARLGDRAPGAHLPGPAPRATHTHGALMETLLDYQWDRPEITSPAKPVLRSRGRRLLDAESEAKEAEAALGGFLNAVFLLAPCPHSQRELVQFVSGCEAQTQRLPPTFKQVMEKLLPKRVQEVMVARKITLYWVDTTEWPKLWESPDHVGYWTICELLQHGGGTVLPSETLGWHFMKPGEKVLGDEGQMSHEPHLSPWILALPPDAALNCLLYNSSEYEASFPRMAGTLFLPVKGKEIQEPCTVTLEPLAMYQRHFQEPVRIFLKGSLVHWSLPMSDTWGTDSWMLQSPEENRSAQGLLFQQLVSRLSVEELPLVAGVDLGEGWPPITGVISPLSSNALILTVFRTKEAEFPRHFLQMAGAEVHQNTASFFSDIVDGVLNQIPKSFEDPAAAAPVPEWAQQELGCTHPWNPTVVEKWFSFSNISGASSNLMESFWLLQTASTNKEDSSKTESELTHCLSELYQRNSREESTVANQEDSRKRRGIPRTPVRQKMNTMCRSLKMLNVARLNVKAQKVHPDGSPDMAGEKGSHRTSVRRAAEKPEDRGRAGRSSKPRDFKTEEELLSYVHENYQKTVATGEITLYSCAQNMISAIKVFLKSKGTKELEVNCLNHIKSNLLKTSESIRQNLGEELDKECKVRECQLQVFLRLEMCLQCPSINESPDAVEQVVEEVTILLRMVCLTEDSAYLANFLEEVLKLYSDSIPETLGKLYNSLGFVIPQKLARVLPADFFSDDSMTQESKSPLLSVPLLSSAHRSVPGSTESEQLEELRTRSAKKRRKNSLIRHKSIAEVSQNLRQIEIPKVSKRTTKNESSHPAPQQSTMPEKGTVQEVTKVRRNLFNQKLISPSKRSLKRGLPRSHSVSTMEGLDCKRDNFKKTKSTTSQGYHKLLTKSVAETPVHKQVSRRLLHRQIKGRSSDPGPDIVVEESPVKGEDETSLRRSPRIKQLSFCRTNSGSFYSVSQPKSRSVQRVHLCQQDKSDQRGNSSIHSIRSPKRLLFGAVSELISPSEMGSAAVKKLTRGKLGPQTPASYQTPKKSCWKSPTFSKTPPRRYPRSPQTPLYTPERPQRSPAEGTPAKQSLSEDSFQGPSSPAFPLKAVSNPSPPPPPSKLGRQCRKSCSSQQGLLECQFGPSAAPRVPRASSSAATACFREDQKGGHLYAHSFPEGQSYLGASVKSDWHRSSPLLVAGDIGDKTKHCGWESCDMRNSLSPGSEGEGLRMVGNQGAPPPASGPGPSSPATLSYIQHCTTDRQQQQAMAQADSPQAPVPSSPQTYEVELEMQASGLPKLRIKKVESSTLMEAEVLEREESPPGNETRPGICLPRGSRFYSKPEATYLSPPRLCPSHSTPGKGRGQTYICQSYTPTRCPPSTPSPFQTDSGVPWTPSPKHNGKTTPDAIKDWPRRKRAVDCSMGPGRGEASGDLPGGVTLPEPQVREPGLELCLHSMSVLENFELEGVYQLPDQSPPTDGVPKAEEASWGQFGLGSRKRLTSAKEEAERGAKRVCGPMSGDYEARKSEEASPSWSAPQLPSMGDDEVFASGCTPPRSCAVRSCLSASGLQALTQSPLLLPGKASSSQHPGTAEEDVAVFPSTAEESPFSRAFSRRRPFGRTYSRKKLIS
ncbi:treslin [Ctenodactylus gundi]